MYRVAALRGGGDQHGIDTASLGESLARRDGICACGEVDGLCTKPAGQMESLHAIVDAQDTTSIGAQHLHGHETHEAQADDGHALTQGGAGQANAL